MEDWFDVMNIFVMEKLETQVRNVFIKVGKDGLSLSIYMDQI